MKKQYYKKSKLGNIQIIHIMMYVTFFCCKTPIYLSILFYSPQSCELKVEINMEMCMIEKSKKIHSKTL